MNRKLCRVSDAIGSLLVKQIAHELKNKNLYMTFANYYEVEGILDLAKYYRSQAAGEDSHHEWIMSYLSDANYKFSYPAVEENNVPIKSLIDPVNASLDREIQTTNMIYAIYDLAGTEKDYMTCAWLYEKLIKEQAEEEDLAKTVIDIMERDGDIFIKASQVLALI